MLGTARRSRWISWALVLVAGEVALYLLWPVIDDNDPPPTLEQQLGLIAALLLLLLPHVIARLAYRGRPWLLTTAGVLGIMLTMLSVLGFSLIFATIPLLLVPSIVYLVRGRFRGGAVLGIGRLTMTVAALALAAIAALFLTEDPRCSIVVRRDGRLVYETPSSCDPTNSGRLGPEIVEWSGTSDVVALHESLLAVGLSAMAIWVCVRTPVGETDRSASFLEASA